VLKNQANNVWLEMTLASVVGDQQDRLSFTWPHAEQSEKWSNSNSVQRALKQARTIKHARARLKHTLSLISIPTMSLSGYNGDRRTNRPPNPQPTSAKRTCKSDWPLSAACSCCCCLSVCGSSSTKLTCACNESASCAGGVESADWTAEVDGVVGFGTAAVGEEGWAASAGSEASVARRSLSAVAVPLAAWKNSWK